MTENVIFNEKQETMFDSELSLAVDNLIILLFQNKRIKEKLPDAKAAVISAMRKCRQGVLHIQDGPTLILEDKVSENLKIINTKK